MKNKAAYLTALQKIEIRDIPMPEPKYGEVIVKMQAVGICGSDIHYYRQGKIGECVVEFPFILGHECAGVVAQVGEGVDALREGDRVALEPGVPCGQCEYCLSGKYNLCPAVKFLATPPYDGCLMRYMAHPAAWCFQIPNTMSFEEGALVEPLAIGINAAQTGRVSLGDTVLIYGAGCIGLMALLAAKAYGATTVYVVDFIDSRLELAEKLGGIAINASQTDVEAEVLKSTDGRGADAVLDCAGFSDTVTGAIHTCRAGGRIVIVGLGDDELNHLPLNLISMKELIITSVFRYRNLYPTTIAAIANGRIDVKRIISNRYPFSDTDKAYRETVENIQNVVKSVIAFE